MIDAPGPWGTGPFVLVEGHSSLDVEQAVTSADPFACTWLQTQDRTPRVRLRANRDYWDRARGPRLEEVVFRNELSRSDAIEKVCTGEGEVDIVTDVPHAQAERVERSEHAKLVTVNPVRALFGVIRRDAEGLPLHDVRARRALNLAVDRAALVRDVFGGRAQGLAGLTPPVGVTALHRAPGRLRPYPHDARRAEQYWLQATGGAPTRTLRLAALGGEEAVAQQVAGDLRSALGLDVEVTVLEGDDGVAARRRLAESHDGDWDVLILEQGCQTADLPALELHRAVLGRSGEFRAGPVDTEFDRRFARLLRQRRQSAQALLSNDVDRYTTAQAPALFLAAPQMLYAVNRHVRFLPYATSFELAETSVGRRHWSRRRRT